MQIADEETDVICENCGRNMVIKYGPHGKFLACPGFPECKNTKPYLEKVGALCPKWWRRDCGTQDEEGAPLLCLREKPGM